LKFVLLSCSNCHLKLREEMQNLPEDSTATVVISIQQPLRSTEQNLAGIRKESTL